MLLGIRLLGTNFEMWVVARSTGGLGSRFKRQGPASILWTELVFVVDCYCIICLWCLFSYFICACTSWTELADQIGAWFGVALQAVRAGLPVLARGLGDNNSNDNNSTQLIVSSNNNNNSTNNNNQNTINNIYIYIYIISSISTRPWCCPPRPAPAPSLGAEDPLTRRSIEFVVCGKS